MSEFVLKVKTRDSQVKDVRVNAEWTIPRLKEELERHTGVAANMQRLIYCGKVLKDDQTISHYGIKEDQTIHLVAKPVNTEPSPPAAPPQPQNGLPPGQLLMGTITVPEGQPVPDLNTLFRSVLGGLGHQQAPQAVAMNVTQRTPAQNIFHTQTSPSIVLPPGSTQPVISGVTLHIHASVSDLDTLPARLERLARQVHFQTVVHIPATQPAPVQFDINQQGATPETPAANDARNESEEKEESVS
eukprot:TRINITY_DN4701_c0_g1_i1.p1 TRINITY_DN4701_c0_g1~~TRINITY_DN4701_c0_g1_i1.p1  ORF type:complete len:261 (-),score=34.12 TRINITY_DN4701_c0_g1_i1:8-739(-)